MSDDTTLNAEQFVDAIAHDRRQALLDHDAAMRAKVERLTERDQCAVQRSITASEVVLLERAEAAEAEVERLTEAVAGMTEAANAELARADAAEAEVERLRTERDGNAQERNIYRVRFNARGSIIADLEARVAALTEALRKTERAAAWALQFVTDRDRKSPEVAQVYVLARDAAAEARAVLGGTETP